MFSICLCICLAQGDEGAVPRGGGVPVEGRPQKGGDGKSFGAEWAEVTSEKNFNFRNEKKTFHRFWVAGTPPPPPPPEETVDIVEVEVANTSKNGAHITSLMETSLAAQADVNYQSAKHRLGRERRRWRGASAR